MPASLLLTSSPTVRGVTRNESQRSDSSAASNTSQSSVTGNKKVSFNKAVRVKKYPRSHKSDSGYGDADDVNGDTGNPSSKRFWFKVYKNKHRQSPDPSEFRRKNEVIYYGNDNGYENDTISYHPNPSVLNYPVFTSECGTQTPNRKGNNTSPRTTLLGNEFIPLHPSQMPSDPPEVRRNYVKKIVNKFNEEAVFQRQKSTEEDQRSPPISPPGSPRLHSTPKHIPIPPPPPPPNPPYMYCSPNLPPPPEGIFSLSRQKKNPIVNGVKVMFGLNGETKSEQHNNDYYKDSNGYKSISPDYSKGSYKIDNVIPEEYETEVKTPYKSQDKFLYGDLDFNNQIVKRDSHKDVVNGRMNGNDEYSYYFDDNEDDPQNRRGKYHVETFDSGNQLLFDTTDVNTATAYTDKGEFKSTVGEKHQLWGNNKRVIVVEEKSPTIIRRKAKSQSDLLNSDDKYHHEDKMDKGVSTDELFVKSPNNKDTLSKKQKDSWLRHFRSSTKDKGIQCNKIPTDEPEELYGFGRYKIIRPKNGIVSAFSNVPNLDKTKSLNHITNDQTNGYSSKDSPSVIYSQIDKTKKKKNGDKEKKKNIFSEDGRIGSLFKSRSEPLYIGPPPKSAQRSEDELEGSYYDDGYRTVKTSKKSFGFRLGVGKENERRNRHPYYEEDWYNVDGDVAAVEKQKRRGRDHRDIAEVRQEMVDEEISDISSLSNGEHKRNGGGNAGSVMREVDYKKREISYENVPRSENENTTHNTVGSGLWYRDADEDYRREMAQSEVSYPAGDNVGSERFYTVDRRDKSSKKLPPPSPRAYTLDRRHLKSKDKQKSVANTSGVKILVNGKEVKEKSSSKKPKKREEPSSVQSDPLIVRGGLAAAYQARQRAAVRRSNSSVSGLSNRYSGSTPNVRRIVASSEMSAASSESDSTRHRRPLVMYIPGVSHTEKSPEQEDRVSSSIARSQSMMAPTRPPRMVKRVNLKTHKGSRSDLYRNGDIYEEDEIMPLASETSRKKPPKVPSDSKKHNDIKRRHSMPKDTKFSWLKWRIRGKPSREP